MQNNVLVYGFALLIFIFLVLFVSPIGGAFGLFVGVWLVIGMLVLVILPYWLIRKFVRPISSEQMTKDFTLRNQLIRLRVVSTTTLSTSKKEDDVDGKGDVKNQQEMKEVTGENVDAPDEQKPFDDLESAIKNPSSKSREKKDPRDQKVTKISWNAFPRPISSPHLRMILVFAVSTGLSLLLVGIIVAAWQVAPYKVCAVYYSSSSSSSPELATTLTTKINFGIESEVYTSQFSLRSLQLLFRYNSVLQLMRLSSNWFEIVGVFGTTSQEECFAKKFVNSKYFSASETNAAGHDDAASLPMKVIGQEENAISSSPRLLTYSLFEDGPFEISSSSSSSTIDEIVSQYSSKLAFHLRDFKSGKRNIVRPLVTSIPLSNENLHLASVGDSRIRIFQDLPFASKSLLLEQTLIENLANKRIQNTDGDVREYKEFIAQQQIYRSMLIDKIIPLNQDVFSKEFLEFFFIYNQEKSSTIKNTTTATTSLPINDLVVNLPVVVNRFSQQDTKLLFSPISGQVVKIFDFSSNKNNKKKFPTFYDIIPESVVLKASNLEQVLDQYFTSGLNAKGMILKSTYYDSSSSSSSVGEKKYVFYTILVVFSGGVCHNGGVDFKFYSSSVVDDVKLSSKNQIEAGTFLNAGDFIGTINSETGLAVTFVLPLLENDDDNDKMTKKVISVPENFVQFDDSLSEISLLTMCSVETLIPARFGIGKI